MLVSIPLQVTSPIFGFRIMRIYYLSPYFLTFMEPRNRFQGMNSASRCSLSGRYDNPIPNRFLAPIDCLKIPALGAFLSDFVSCGCIACQPRYIFRRYTFLAFYSKHSHTRAGYKTWTDTKVSSYKTTLIGRE
jgi:hypothetical protein